MAPVSVALDKECMIDMMATEPSSCTGNNNALDKAFLSLLSSMSSSIAENKNRIILRINRIIAAPPISFIAALTKPGYALNENRHCMPMGVVSRYSNTPKIDWFIKSQYAIDSLMAQPPATLWEAYQLLALERQRAASKTKAIPKKVDWRRPKIFELIEDIGPPLFGRFLLNPKSHMVEIVKLFEPSRCGFKENHTGIIAHLRALHEAKNSDVIYSKVTDPITVEQLFEEKLNVSAATRFYRGIKQDPEKIVVVHQYAFVGLDSEPMKKCEIYLICQSDQPDYQNSLVIVVHPNLFKYSDIYAVSNHHSDRDVCKTLKRLAKEVALSPVGKEHFSEIDANVASKAIEKIKDFIAGTSLAVPMDVKLFVSQLSVAVEEGNLFSFLSSYVCTNEKYQWYCSSLKIIETLMWYPDTLQSTNELQRFFAELEPHYQQLMSIEVTSIDAFKDNLKTISRHLALLSYHLANHCLVERGNMAIIEWLLRFCIQRLGFEIIFHSCLLPFDWQAFFIWNLDDYIEWFYHTVTFRPLLLSKSSKLWQRKGSVDQTEGLVTHHRSYS